jgi:predicted DNA-binding protein (MmcQ/YjbR family)
MDVDSIREYCLSFPKSTENLQWGDNLCFKVGGKIFVILGLDHLQICFKSSADKFAELVERENIAPAPYVGRYKWVMLERLDAVSEQELKELVQQSYEMVAAKVPKRASKGRARKSSSKLTVRRGRAKPRSKPAA